MRALLLAATVVLSLSPARADTRDPYDAFSYEVVYQTPAMKDVRARRDVVFAQGERGPLRLDVYYPPGTGRAAPPAVVFANVVGERGSRPLRDAQVYQSWARLLAAHGIAGVPMASEAAHAGDNLGQAVEHLEAHARELGIDGQRLGVWACSANVTIALPYLMERAPAEIRTGVVYYGNAPLGRLRTDLPLLYVLATKDGPALIAGERAAWEQARRDDAPWTMVVARDLPHAFDAVDNSEASRRLVGETVDYLVRQLTTPPPPRALLRAGGERRGRRGLPEAPRAPVPRAARAPARAVNLACALALGGKRDQALARLDEAVAAGFVDRQQIETDPDLTSLRQDPCYRTIVERVQP